MLNLEDRTHSIRDLMTSWLQRNKGKGPILLLLHGYPDTPNTFESLVSKLPKEWDLVIPWARGTGPSEGNCSTRRYGPDQVYQDTVKILKHVDPKEERKIIVLGHDIGATHGWWIAERLGDRLGALIFWGGVSLDQYTQGLRQYKQLALSPFFGFMQIPFIPEVVIGILRKPLTRAGRQIGKDPLATETEGFLDLEACLQPINQYRACLRLLLTRPRNEKNKNIKAPILAIWGSEDPFISAPTKDQLDKDGTNITIRIIEGGHWIHKEKPDQVSDIIMNFLIENDVVCQA